MTPTPPPTSPIANTIASAESSDLPNRRDFLTKLLGATAAGAAGLPLLAAAPADGAELPTSVFRSRRSRAYRLRNVAALFHRKQRVAQHDANGDEELVPRFAANFSKGLPHSAIGEVDPTAYQALLHAVRRGEPEDFEAIPSGVADPAQRRRLVNPQGGLAFDLEGADSHEVTMLPAPAFASAEQAGEVIELYWMALTRDVPFAQYDSNPLIAQACDDLSTLTDFRGPRIRDRITPGTIFRGLTPGDRVGPYVSQFLLQPAPFGANYVEQRMRCCVPNVDYMTNFADWLAIQRGFAPSAANQFDPVRRFIRCGRDLAQWAHIDVLYQAYFHAMLILLRGPDASELNSSGLGAPFDLSNPYAHSANQDGFATFGGPHIASLMCEVATRALKAVWFQKWFVHRRLRPEVFAARVHNQIVGTARYPLFEDDLFSSPALTSVFSKHGTYLLPQAYPEGSPLHPAYGAGHATVAGACVTILKAWFDEHHVIPNPVQPAANGLSLQPYTGPALTVGGELNKLASNVAFGRNWSGIHWRSDAIESFKLGEAIAISVLRDQHATYNEHFDGFSLTRFDGATMQI